MLLQNPQTKNREPRKQSHSNKANVVKVEEPELEQTPNLKLKFYETLTRRFLTVLALSKITHRVQNKNSITKAHQEEGMHSTISNMLLLQNIHFQKKNSERKTERKSVIPLKF